MKKIKLYSIGNEKNYNYYVFDKTNNVVEVLSQILGKVFLLNWYLYYEPIRKKDYKWMKQKKNFDKMKEGHENISGYGKGNSRVDVFYGKKKMSIIVHCSTSLREKFNEELGKVSYMPKVKKTEKKKVKK